jgi:hypothetical protein
LEFYGAEKKLWIGSQCVGWRLSMKVGDLVTWTWGDGKEAGVIIEIGIYAGNNDMKVYWWDSVVMTEKSEQLKVISESR